MSRDSSGESLEAILASIRRSLAEQATSILEDEAVAPAERLPPADPPTDLDAPPIPASLSKQLAIAPAAPGPAAASDPAVVPAPAVAPAPTGDPVPSIAPVGDVGQAPGVLAAAEARAEIAPAPAPAAAAEPTRGEPDPLWFLSQEPGSRAAAQTAGVDGGGAPLPPASEPKPSRLGAARGPLAPFFGSSAAEVVKVEMVPDRPVRSGTGAMPPFTSSQSSPAAAQPLEGLHAVNGEALRGLNAPPRAPDGAGVMRTSSIFGPPPADAGAGTVAEAQAPQIQALEAMVAELLRPMLRRWLDENMPRLVSAALQAEAELMSRRDPKKP